MLFEVIELPLTKPPIEVYAPFAVALLPMAFKEAIGVGLESVMVPLVNVPEFKVAFQYSVALNAEIASPILIQPAALLLNASTVITGLVTVVVVIVNG
jgi:hypothetical protein